MLNQTVFISFLLLAMNFVDPGVAKVSKGTFYAADAQWAFLDKFCFDSKGGKLDLWIKPSVNQTGLMVVVYHDLPHGFPSVYSTDNSCQYKVKRSAWTLDASNPVFQSKEGKKITVAGDRPRWWFVGLANCDEKDVQEISVDDYTIHFMNTGGKFTSEFSKNEEGIFETAIVVLILLICLTILMSVWICMPRGNATKVTNAGDIALLTAVGFEFLSVIFQLVHRDTYSKNGIGYPNLEKFCDFLNFFPEMILLILFLCIAKGWHMGGSPGFSGSKKKNSSWRTVTPGFSSPTKDNSRWRTTKELLVLFFITDIALLFWGQKQMDPAVDQEVYQSAPGVILVILRVLTMCWFISCITATRRNTKNDSFYERFALFGTVWFLYVPFMVVVAEILQDWNRKKVVVIMTYMFDTITYFVFWLLNDATDYYGDSKESVPTDEFDCDDTLQQT